MDKRSALTIQIYHSTFTESDIFSPFLYCVFGKGYRHLTEIELCFSTKTTLLKLYPSSLKIQLNPRLLLTSLLLDKISQDSSCRRSAAVSKGTVLNCRLFCFFFWGGEAMWANQQFRSTTSKLVRRATISTNITAWKSQRTLWEVGELKAHAVFSQNHR